MPATASKPAPKAPPAEPVNHMAFEDYSDVRNALRRRRDLKAELDGLDDAMRSTCRRLLAPVEMQEPAGNPQAAATSNSYAIGTDSVTGKPIVMRDSGAKGWRVPSGWPINPAQRRLQIRPELQAVEAFIRKLVAIYADKTHVSPLPPFWIVYWPDHADVPIIRPASLSDMLLGRLNEGRRADAEPGETNCHGFAIALQNKRYTRDADNWPLIAELQALDAEVGGGAYLWRSGVAAWRPPAEKPVKRRRPGADDDDEEDDSPRVGRPGRIPDEID